MQYFYLLGELNFWESSNLLNLIYKLIILSSGIELSKDRFACQIFNCCQSDTNATDTWGQLVLLTTILNHKTCINTSRQVLEKTLFAINAIFTQDNNLSKTKVEGSLQKPNATCSKFKTNLILTYLHRSWRHSSSQSQKRESTILSYKNKLLPNISSVNEIFGPTQCCLMVPCWKAFLKCTASEQESQSVQIVFCSLAVHVRKAFSAGYHC